MSQAEIEDDLLLGAEAIAGAIFGRTDKKTRRRVYHLVDELPVFRLGGILCARRSTLTAWIAAQEAAPLRPLRKKSKAAA
jgi:hypothetical protein